MTIDRTIFFDSVRGSLFSGTMSQSQVDGMNAILFAWEARPTSDDPRWLAYMLATTLHETASTMQPIEEYGQGAGMTYGEPDPVTGEAYYGRGFVQLTWADNYKRADDEIGLANELSCYLHPENQLKPLIAAVTMFRGMSVGWFRGDKLSDYFAADVDDPFNAREIINGDKTKVPGWSGGLSIGKVIEGYHDEFLEAITEAMA
jgi:hypothetical protein